MEPAKSQPINQPPPETSLHFLDYWRIIRIRKTVIISVFLLIAITATVVTFVLPESYSSTARIKINPDVTDIQSMSGTQSPYTPYDPYFIQTEFSIMQSEKVLTRVIDALDLNNKWGVKYNGGAPLKTEDTMQLLKQRMGLSPERNTKLIDITVYSEDRDDAARVANGIAQAYQDYRLALLSTNTLAGIGVLMKEFKAEDDEIAALQTNVDQLRKKFNIVDTDPQSTGPTPTLSQVTLQQYNIQQIDQEKEYSKLRVQLEKLQTIQQTNPADLRNALPTMMQDSELSSLLSQLNQTEQSLAVLKVDYSTNWPDVIKMQSNKDKLESMIDKRIRGLMITLSIQADALKASLDEQNARVQAAIKNDREEAERGQPYWELKRTLETKRELHKILEAKITQEKIDWALPRTTMVSIVDPAQPGKSPVRPNKTLNIILGIVIGLMVGVGLAFFID